MAGANYRSRFEHAKMMAQQGINSAIAQLQTDITNSVNVLKASGQTVPFDLEEVVKLLEDARDAWINDMRGVFDSAILSMKGNLSPLVQPKA